MRNRLDFFCRRFEFSEPASTTLEYMTKDTAKLSGPESLMARAGRGGGGVSALRAGASVKAVLSGEPGRYMETKGFVSTENEGLAVPTDYLGTGYAFGISRLETDFRDRRERKTHIMIITDDDIFSMPGVSPPFATWRI